MILVCIHENETQDRPENFVSICSESQVALKALQTAKTTSLLVWQGQKALNYISTCTTWASTGSFGHAGYKEMKLPTSLEETALLKGFWT